MSVSAASCGDEKTEPGDSDPALDCEAPNTARRLVETFLLRLVEDVLGRTRKSCSCWPSDAVAAVSGKSVRRLRTGVLSAGVEGAFTGVAVETVSRSNLESPSAFQIDDELTTSSFAGHGGEERAGATECSVALAPLSSVCEVFEDSGVAEPARVGRSERAEVRSPIEDGMDEWSRGERAGGQRGLQEREDRRSEDQMKIKDEVKVVENAKIY